MSKEPAKLIVLEKAHELALQVYRATNSFPKTEIFGLTSQIRRAAVSVPSNIVEGKARSSNKDFKRFLLISRGSLEETKYQLLLAKDLEYMSLAEYNRIIYLANDVGRLLNAFINKLQDS